MKGYTTKKVKILSGEKDMELLILQPKKALEEKPPAVLWIHGGGYATGFAAMVHKSRAANLAEKYGAVVFSPEYTLSGKAPYPAQLHDCYAALLYIKNKAEELGIDPDRIMVGGESAGGGICAALTLYARDRGEVNIAFQMPLYPMLDDRDTESSRNNHHITWNTKRNHAAWKLYLGDAAGNPPQYAAPARAEDLTGLPPAYTFVGSKETFYSETAAYVERLKRAGVPAVMDVYPTGFHAFDILMPFLRMSKQAAAAFEKQYLYAAANFRAPQKN